MRGDVVELWRFHKPKITHKMQTRSITQIITALVFAAGATFVGAQNANQQNPADGFKKFSKELGLQTTYSADMEMTAMGMPMTAKVIHDGDKQRTDTTVPLINIKVSTVQITKGGKTTGFTLYPSIKKYAVKPVQDAPDAANAPEIVVTDKGSETYEGEKCAKKQVEIKGDNPMTFDILLSPKNKNMPVKTVSTIAIPDQSGRTSGGNTAMVTILFKNYDFKKPDASLFEIPKDYTQAESEEAAMKEAMSAGGGGNPFAALMAMAAAAEAAAGNDDDDDDDDDDDEPVSRRPASRNAQPPARTPPANRTPEPPKDSLLDGALRMFGR